MSKIRVASYYENRLGRNDGNPLYMHHAFKNLGVEAGHLIPFGNITGFGTWDLHFEADWGEDALLDILPYKTLPIPSPSVFWNSDTHISDNSYKWRLEKALRTDWNFVCQKRACEDFARDGVKNIHFMPHAVEPMAYPTFQEFENRMSGRNVLDYPGDHPYKISQLTKKYDLCFIGHINSENRIEALDRMFKAFPNFFYGQRLFEEAAVKYHDSKVVFNISITDDINMRCFEVMSTKSFLLTNWIPTLGDLFEDGKHLVTYKTIDEAIDKAKYYLEHDEERDKIAQAGFEEVRSKHTFLHRAKQVLDTCLPGWNKSEVKELAHASSL